MLPEVLGPSPQKSPTRHNAPLRDRLQRTPAPESQTAILPDTTSLKAAWRQRDRERAQQEAAQADAPVDAVALLVELPPVDPAPQPWSAEPIGLPTAEGDSQYAMQHMMESLVSLYPYTQAEYKGYIYLGYIYFSILGCFCYFI